VYQAKWLWPEPAAGVEAAGVADLVAGAEEAVAALPLKAEGNGRAFLREGLNWFTASCEVGFLQHTRQLYP